MVSSRGPKFVGSPVSNLSQLPSLSYNNVLSSSILSEPVAGLYVARNHIFNVLSIHFHL